MFISRETDYALRILRSLHRGGQLPARVIREETGLSMPVAYKTLDRLGRAGLVTSRRGAEGGYALAVPCEGMTLYDVLRMLEADLVVNRCMEKDYVCEAWSGDTRTCGLHRECCRIQTFLETELKRTPLSEIFDE